MLTKKLAHKRYFLRSNFNLKKKLTLRSVHAILKMYKPMFFRLALVISWFLFAPLAIALSVIFLNQDSQIIMSAQKITSAKPGEYQKTDNHINSQILGVEINDTRPYIVSNFLENTALEPYSHTIVEVSDKYGIDYKLIPAIAMKESGGGNKAPPGTYNAWGFENGKTRFDSWNQAIETVAKTLKERYVEKGLITPDQIMPVYAPPQITSGGKWAKDVNYFFTKMESL